MKTWSTQACSPAAMRATKPSETLPCGTKEPARRVWSAAWARPARPGPTPPPGAAHLQGPGRMLLQHHLAGRVLGSRAARSAARSFWRRFPWENMMLRRCLSAVCPQPSRRADKPTCAGVDRAGLTITTSLHSLPDGGMVEPSRRRADLLDRGVCPGRTPPLLVC
jgi:hypothetical protein